MHKLNKYVEFKIPDEAKPIINRYKKNGRVYFSKNNTEDEIRRFLTTTTKLLAQLTGIKKIIYYSAHKSFSQHAFTLNINTYIIDYILGHKIDNGKNSLYNYIKIIPDMATDAIRKVLDNLK